jgi:hypothetical protein
MPIDSVSTCGSVAPSVSTNAFIAREGRAPARLDRGVAPGWPCSPRNVKPRLGLDRFGQRFDVPPVHADACWPRRRYCPATSTFSGARSLLTMSGPMRPTSRSLSPWSAPSREIVAALAHSCFRLQVADQVPLDT